MVGGGGELAVWGEIEPSGGPCAPLDETLIGTVSL